MALKQIRNGFELKMQIFHAMVWPVNGYPMPNLMEMKCLKDWQMIPMCISVYSVKKSPAYGDPPLICGYPYNNRH